MPCRLAAAPTKPRCYGPESSVIAMRRPILMHPAHRRLPLIGVESHLIFNPWQQERQSLSRDFGTAGICRRPRIAQSRQSPKPPTRGGFRVSASRYPNVAECGAASLSQEVSPMSRSDFDVVTGPSMAQRRAPVPEQSNKSSDSASGPGAEPARSTGASRRKELGEVVG